MSPSERSPVRAAAGAASAPDAFWVDARVYYEDTDAAGVVYYANYLRYMERARTEWLEQLGMSLERLHGEHRVTFAVHRLDIEYVQPARLGDRLRVSVELEHRGHARLAITQRVTRGGEVLVRARVTLACIDPLRWTPARIPQALLTRTHNL